MNLILEIAPYVAIAAFLSFFATILFFTRFVSTRTLSSGLVLSVVILASSVVLLMFTNYAVRNIINEYISSPQVRAYWNGNVVPNTEFLFSRLKNITLTKKSGSEPTSGNQLKLVSVDRSLILDLKKDSRDADLYWIFYPPLSELTTIGYVRINIETALSYNDSNRSDR